MREGNTELLLSDTLVPDIFIIQYMQDLSFDAVKLYLLILAKKLESFKREDLCIFTSFPANVIDDKLTELISIGLVCRKGDDAYYLADLKQIEALEFAKSYASRGVTLAGTELSADEEARNTLSRSISNQFYLGKLMHWGYRLIDKCLYDYKFDSAVVYQLFQEGVTRKIHLKATAMKNMAEDWYNKGYVTTESLAPYFENQSKITAIIELWGRLTRSKVDGIDIESISKWVEVLGYDQAIVEYAYKQCKFRGRVTIKIVEDKLFEWHNAGIKSIDKALVYENERHEENKRKATRKRGTDSVWKTGREAGIKAEDSKTDKPGTSDESGSGEVDDILDLFGGSDDND